MIDGQLVHLAHRRHSVPLHVALTSFAKGVLLLAINLDLDFDIRYIPDAVMDDVSVRGELVVSILELIDNQVLPILGSQNFEISKF